MNALRIACYVASALLLGGAGAYLLLGSNTGLGIFLVLLAAILCRVLIINIAGTIEQAYDGRHDE